MTAGHKVHREKLLSKSPVKCNGLQVIQRSPSKNVLNTIILRVKVSVKILHVVECSKQSR